MAGGHHKEWFTAAELAAGPALSDLVKAKLTANADVNLHLVASFGGSANFPTITSDFALHWAFQNAPMESPDNSFGGKPTVAFNNVQLNAGEFFGNFAKPILDNVQKVLKPIQPVIDILTTKLPVLSDLKVARNLLDFDVMSASGGQAQVSGHGLSLVGTAVHPVAVGDQVRVAIRPHDLNVVANGTGSQNSFDALVNVVEYQGREFAVGVTTSTGQNLFVHAEVAPAVGEHVTLTVDPARALVYQANLDRENIAAPASTITEPERVSS